MLKKIKYFFIEYYHRPSAKLYSIYVFFKLLIYNSNTTIISEKTFLLKDPPNSMRYYNLFGRMLYIIINLIFVSVFRKFLDQSLKLDDYININKEGDDFSTWPNQSFNINEENYKIEDEFYRKITEDYFENVKLSKKNKELSENKWWQECRQEFSNIFFEKNELDIEKLENFRNEISTKAEILNDQNYISRSKSKFSNMVNSLKLVNLYHKLSVKVDLNILRKISESNVGNNFCPIYRNQRISHRILRYAYYSSSIKNSTNLEKNEKNIFLDIGGGYGGLSRTLKYIYKNSTFIIIELPELCLLASFFLKKCFKNSKIATTSSFKGKKIIKKSELINYDFVVLTQEFIEKIESDTADISINTTSLGEMTDSTQDFYIKSIERVTKSYFYSVNRPKKRVKKYNSRGYYQFNFENRWDCILYNFTHTYHIEFLGKKNR